jgi:catechol 2,3-dioxygenase-like lactoylglutathione lyase family enzyme
MNGGPMNGGPMNGGLADVTISAAEFDRSAAFYDAALGALGMARVIELGDEEEDAAAAEAIGWGCGEHAVLWLVAGRPVTRGVHVRLRARSRDDVERFHRAGLAAGGRSHDAPRRWAIYRQGEFNAILLDPDGNLLEAVAPE